MENELAWFIPAHVRGRSISSCGLDPGDGWSSSFPRPLDAQPIFDYLSDLNPLHIDQSLFLLLKIQEPCGIEGPPFIYPSTHPSSQLVSMHALCWGTEILSVITKGNHLSQIRKLVLVTQRTIP